MVDELTLGTSSLSLWPLYNTLLEFFNCLNFSWIIFQGDAGSSLLAIPNYSTNPADEVEQYYSANVQGYGFNASHYSMEELIHRKHDHELVSDPNSVYFHIDSQTMGLGGYDSWSPNVDDEFLIKPRNGLEVKVRFALI